MPQNNPGELPIGELWRLRDACTGLTWSVSGTRRFQILSTDSRGISMYHGSFISAEEAALFVQIFNTLPDIINELIDHRRNRCSSENQNP